MNIRYKKSQFDVLAQALLTDGIIITLLYLTAFRFRVQRFCKAQELARDY